MNDIDHVVATPVPAIDTKLDGSFTIDNVKPGKYYVTVEKQGYLSPMAQFSVDELEQPTPDLKKKIAKALQQITVDANQTVSIEVRLERAAAISGSVRFDDGSPAAGLIVKALRKEKDGKWRPPARNRFWSAIETDDQGHYRIAGLPAAEYIVETDLTLIESMVSNLLSIGGRTETFDKFSLSFFSGGSARQRDAAAFKLTEGEERTGEDIVVPLAKLQPVAGTVIAKRDGHVVNAGKLTLLYADDRTPAASTDVDKEDSAFHFEFVPEGDYILTVKNARDVVREEVADPPGSEPPSHTNEKVLHAYGDSEQPVTIHGDTSGLVISVPETSTKAAAASGPQ
jgi:hypothetical protein